MGIEYLEDFSEFIAKRERFLRCDKANLLSSIEKIELKKNWDVATEWHAIYTKEKHRFFNSLRIFMAFKDPERTPIFIVLDNNDLILSVSNKKEDLLEHKEWMDNLKNQIERYSFLEKIILREVNEKHPAINIEIKNNSLWIEGKSICECRLGIEQFPGFLNYPYKSKIFFDLFRFETYNENDLIQKAVKMIEKKATKFEQQKIRFLL